MIRTGRIDRRGGHDGVPPEPMAIFIKWLAREHRERTRWAEQYLKNTAVTWQFDSADGLKYALLYDSAARAGVGPADATLEVRAGATGVFAAPARARGTHLWRMSASSDVGVFGDWSFRYQSDITARLRGWIERQAGT
jgi:hypothetical protein